MSYCGLVIGDCRFPDCRLWIEIEDWRFPDRRLSIEIGECGLAQQSSIANLNPPSQSALANQQIANHQSSIRSRF
jgi:hypothetical protein